MKKIIRILLLVTLCLIFFVTTVSASGYPTFDFMAWIQRKTADTKKEINDQKVLLQLYNTYKENKDSNQAILKTFAVTLGSEEMFNMIFKDFKSVINGDLKQYKNRLKVNGDDILGSLASKIIKKRKKSKSSSISDLLEEEKPASTPERSQIEIKRDSNTIAVLSGDDVQGGDSNNPGKRLYLKQQMLNYVIDDMQMKYSNFYVDPKTGKITKTVFSPDNETSTCYFVEEQLNLLPALNKQLSKMQSNSTLISQIQLNNQLQLMQIQATLKLLEAQTDMNRLLMIQSFHDYDQISDTVDSYLRRKR